jgi:hypothetical protein
MELSQQPQSVKQLVLKKMITPSFLVILLMGLFALFSFEFQMKWIGSVFEMDVDQYYSYLVAEFIHHDLSFHFPHHYWLVEAPNGALVPKVTMGMSLMYLPFFVLGNNIAHLYAYDPLGYSQPFAWCIHFGSLVYVFLGFWYMRKTLLLFFSEWVAAITMLLILFATNLFYYTFREGEMSHGYLFCLLSVFFYHSVKWHFTMKNKYLYYLSFMAGFITLIRPTEILVLLIPLLYQVTSVPELVAKLKELGALKWKLLVAILLFMAPLIPQFLFWKVHTGQFLFFSYGNDEHFFFADPKIYNVLFGWHKGWFVYTPLVFFMVAGLIMMCFKWKRMALPIGVYLLLTIYVVSSWWDWGFGGAYGMRALVQTFAFMALPLAFFIKWTFSISKLKFRIPVVVITFAMYLFFATVNLFHMWQIKNFVFHWDSMTKEAYWFTFFKTEYSKTEGIYFDLLLKHPNYEEMRKGNRDEK